MKKDKFRNHPAKDYTSHPPLEGPMNNIGLFTTDPQGSYTGRPMEKWEQPVQDADDL